MAAQRGHFEASASRGALGVHSVDHLTLILSDLGGAQDYFTHFGLDVRERGRFLQLRTYGNDHTWSIVVEGPRKRLHHISFGCFASDLPRFKRWPSCTTADAQSTRRLSMTVSINCQQPAS